MKNKTELSEITDDIVRLYLTSVFFILNGGLYSLNLNFEKILGLESTIKKIKEKAIENIINTNAFSSDCNYSQLLASYSSPRTFLTLKDKRLNKLNSKDGIKEISEILELKLKDDKIIF